jgi:cytochrome P450
VHHSARYWPDPEQFRPERFSAENKKEQKAFTHLPFGGGPKGCIGGNYAMLQMLMILSVILTEHDFQLAPDQRIEARPMIILRPKYGIKMQFGRREAA